MTYDDFMTILDETNGVIVSRELFTSLLESQMSTKITGLKQIYEAYNLGYNTAQNEKTIHNHHGRWMLSDARMQLYECDSCRYQMKDRMPFCPWCGAAMDNPVIGVRSRNKSEGGEKE